VIRSVIWSVIRSMIWSVIQSVIRSMIRSVIWSGPVWSWFCRCRLKSLEIRLFYRKLNSRKRGNSLSVFHRNSPKCSNDQRGKLDWSWLKFYGERNTALCAITAPSYKQPSKLSQLQNTQLNLLTVTFLAILKWTEINLHWLIVNGRVKKAKDWRLLPTLGAKFRLQRKNLAHGPYRKKLDRSRTYD